MDVLHASVGGKTKGVELLRDRFIHPLATHQNVPDKEPALTQIRQLAPLMLRPYSMHFSPLLSNTSTGLAL